MKPILSNPKASRTIATTLAMVTAIYASLFCVARPADVARSLRYDAAQTSTLIFEIGILAAASLLLLSLYMLANRQFKRAQAMRRLHTAQAGTVIVEFTLVFPIILLIMGMIVQLAIFANASLVVRYAAFASARSASVSFTRSFVGIQEDLELEPELYKESAYLVLASISPANSSFDPQAAVLRTIQARQNGPWGSQSLPQRMAYARSGTTVTYEDGYPPLDSLPFSINIPLVPPKQVTVTVKYKCAITMPGIYTFPGLGLTVPNPPGFSGRSVELTHSVTLQGTGARVSQPASLLPIFGISPVPGGGDLF